jgi:IS5 family transposase
MGHVVMENRHGLVVRAQATTATGVAERDTAEDLLEALAGDRRVTVGADKGFDTPEFVAALRDLNVTPHVAQNTSKRRSAVDGRTTRHPGYDLSQRIRKRVEEIFGWLKTVGLMRKVRHRGTDRVDWMFVFACAIYNLVRIRTLTAAEA